jgi:hypothetical protein
MELKFVVLSFEKNQQGCQTIFDNFRKKETRLSDKRKRNSGSEIESYGSPFADTIIIVDKLVVLGLLQEEVSRASPTTVLVQVPPRSESIESVFVVRAIVRHPYVLSSFRVTSQLDD